MSTITLYRPIGEKELILIIDLNYSAFPPRLNWQPIFYPVLNEEYACDIASRWNTNDEAGNYLGFVTKFSVSAEEYSTYKVQNVGLNHHNELWVPSEDLARFNGAIAGPIEIIKCFKGEGYKGSEDKRVTDIINQLEMTK